MPPFQISEYATGRTYMWYVCLSEKDTPSTYNLQQHSLRRILRSADNNIITKNFFLYRMLFTDVYQGYYRMYVHCIV